MITIGTDFSGIGSPEQALINLGIKHKSMFACDIDKYAKQSYLANYKTENFYDDITKRNHNKTPYVDLYVAGFPCQAFSMAGKREGLKDTRGTLFFDLLKYLKAKKPKYFILENVKGLLSDNGGKTFLTILDCLAKTVNGQYSFTNYEDGLNYYVYYKVLNTKDFGIPQNREHIFIVGFREDNHTFKFPKELLLKTKLKDLLEDVVAEKFYLKDETVQKLIDYTKRNKEKGNGFRAKFHNPNIDNMSSLKVKGQGADDLIRVHSLYSRFSKTNKGGTGPISKDDGTFCIDTGNDQAIEIHGTITGAIGRAGSSSEYLASCNAVSSNTKRIRRLTPLECIRLQGFPDEFYYKCKENGLSDTQLYKQAGNSITVNVMQKLIKEILINNGQK